MQGYSSERIRLFAALIKAGDIFNGKYWLLDPKELRFRHGETIAELKVPYHMGADDEAVIENAVLALVSLLMKRYEPGRVEPPPVHVQLKEKTYRTDIFLPESFEKMAAGNILESVPYIDSAIIAAWLSPDGHGKMFVKWLTALIEKAMKDEVRHSTRERTAYLALLAAISAIRKKKDGLKDLRIKGISYERIDLAVGLTLFMTVSLALKALLHELSGAPYLNERTAELLLSALTPKSFLAIPSSLLASSLNPYFISSEVYDALLKAAPEPSDKADMPGLVKATAEKAAASDEAISALKAYGGIRRFRHEAFAYLTEFDIPGTQAQAMLYDLYCEDRLIKNLLGDQKQQAVLGAALEDVKKKFSKDARLADRLTSFQSYLSSLKKPAFWGLFKGEEAAGVHILSDAVEGCYAYRLDDTAEKFTSLVRSYLVDRRQEFAQNTLLGEYKKGRLYRFAIDERPILKSLELHEEGQLFIDMKNFTRKTLKVKEIAMAEFMKEFFYSPILAAADRYGAGTGLTGEELGIRLTNLPGDAAVFSGGVRYLVALAKDIQKVIRRYRDQLANKLPPGSGEDMLAEITKKFEAKKEELKFKRLKLREAVQRNENGVDAKLMGLGEEEHRLEDTFRDELESAVMGELEAGLYISYGAKAETMALDSSAEGPGAVKVAIGEKINEAARGTTRNALVRAKLEMLLESEKEKRKQMNLKYPFDVYIGRTYSLKMPPELDTAFEKLFSTRKPQSAQAMAQAVAQEYFNDLRKVIAGSPFSELRIITASTDIYNKGQALSHDALEAYIKETKDTRRYFPKTVNVADLDPSIKDSFFFPMERLELWVGAGGKDSPETFEIFARAGEIIFKGFETNTPTVIYEMLNPEGDFFRALIRCHFAQWFDEAVSSQATEPSGD